MCDNTGMLAVMLALVLQSTSIKGSLDIPRGMPPPTAARVVLLPLEYAKAFNAETQIRLDNYWEVFKESGLAKTDREQFIQFMPIAYGSALENAVARMRRDSKINLANLIRTAPQGQFEFNNISPGEYKLVATASLRGVDYVWMETVQVQSTPVVLQMKYRVP
jgi:hypothetical protein